MKVKILASDSMGTRSMVTYIETSDLKFFIDPGVALGPSRYGLPPHKKEEEKLEEHWEKIKNYAKKCKAIAITHYHYDHYNPNDGLEIYENKVIYLKHPTENINKSQKERAAYFLEQIRDLAKEIVFSDGEEVKFGKTKIKFSKAVFHGTNPKLGYVTEIFVDDGREKFIHTSDVEGPAVKDQVDFILRNCPTILFVDGPLSYMLGYRYSYDMLNKSIKNLIRIISECKMKYLIIDHHFLRDLKWKDRIKEVFEKAGKTKIVCAAEFMGQKVEMLEANRKELWGK